MVFSVLIILCKIATKYRRSVADHAFRNYFSVTGVVWRKNAYGWIPELTYIIPCPLRSLSKNLQVVMHVEETKTKK